MLKRSISIIFCLAFLMACNMPLAGAEGMADLNLVSDPSFETSTGFGVNENSNWAFEKAQGSATTATIDTAEKHTGNNAVKIDGRTRVQDTVRTFPIHIQRGRAYEYSAWVKVSANAQFSLDAVFTYTDSNGNNITEWKAPTASVRTTANAGVWTQVKGVFTYAPKGEDLGVANVQFALIEYSTVSSSIWLDDYCLKPLVAPLVIGQDGVLTSATSSKTVLLTTTMSNPTTWSVDSLATENGITIDHGKLFIPNGISTAFDITITVSGTDYGIATTLTKKISVGTNKINLAKDSGFENSVNFVGNPNWVINGVDQNPSMVVTVEKDVARGNVAKVDGRSSGQHLGSVITNYITPQASREYKISAWVKVPSNSLMAIQDVVNSTWTIGTNTSVQPVANTWTQLSYLRTFTSATDMRFLVTGRGTTVYNPTMWLDDYAMTPTKVQNAVEITATNTYVLPISGSETHTLTAAVKNQDNTTDQVSQTVKWSLVNPPQGVTIDANGVLTLPSDAQDGRFILRAEATEFGVITTSEKLLEVYKNVTDEVAVQNAAANVINGDISKEDLNCITKNITLPSVGTYATTISWASSDQTVIAIDGTVNRPQDENKNVTLTATISRGSAIITKTVNLCVSRRVNLLAIPSFEGVSSLPSGWTKSGAINAAIVSEAGRGNIAYVTGRTANWHAVKSEVVSIQKGVEYEYSAWIKIPSQVSKGNGFGLQINDSYVTITEGLSVIPTSGEWFKIRALYTMAGEGTGTAAINIGERTGYATNGITNEYYIDDFCIRRISANDVLYGQTKFYSGGTDANGYIDDGVSLLTTPIVGNVAVNTLIYAKDADRLVTLATVVYDGNKLINCSIKTETIGKKQIKNIYANVYCGDGNYNIKTILLDDFGNLIPLRVVTILE